MKNFLLFLIICSAVMLLIGWSNEQSDYSIKPKERLGELSGKLSIVRPWRTQNYLLLNSNGDSNRFSCAGPYGKGYWCGRIDSHEFSKESFYVVRYDQFNGINYVYEIFENGNPIVVYSEQVELYNGAIMQGKSHVKLVASIFLGAMALIFSIIW